jgi:MFS transporter, DHA1 family, multidrug resistance protein
MKNKKSLIFLIMFMGILAPILIDEYAPSMPAMVTSLNSTTSMIQITISLMLLGLCLGQLILGPLSDRFGRRPIVMIGVGLALLASLLCVFAQSADILLIGRFFQGFGSAAAALTCTALIGESFEGDEIARVTGLFILIYGFVPIASPVIGGHIQAWLGWRSNFIFLLLVLAVAFLFFWIKMPETVDASKSEKLHINLLARAYGAVLTNKKYMSAVIGGMFSWATIITFSLLGPFLIQNTLGFSANAYGYLALIAGLGFLAGNLVNTQALKKHAAACVLRCGVYIALLSSIAALALFCFGLQTIWVMMITSLCLLFGVGLTFPNYYGFAVGVFTKNYVGVANALIGALILVGTVIYSFILSHFHAHSFYVLGAVYVILAGCNLLSSLFCLSAQKSA